jgi:hypothetical protein
MKKKTFKNSKVHKNRLKIEIKNCDRKYFKTKNKIWNIYEDQKLINPKIYTSIYCYGYYANPNTIEYSRA